MIIAGPCSAETRSQVIDTARALHGYVDAFRVGVWKPRTRPGTFEGAGSEALRWIEELKSELPLKVAVEVATPRHVEEALKAGIDIFWIGARTTTNPFLVQDICESLHGVDVPVFVKNPMNPDAELWAGAIERLHNAGVRSVGAIHRGFSYYGKPRWRNVPQWQVAIDLKQKFPGITLLADPSHLTGDCRYVPEAASAAMALGFDGLFIESHINPAAALSDASQQLTPAELKSLLANLARPDREGTDADKAMLAEYRSRIDLIDGSLLELLAQRMEISREIGRYKKKRNITILQQSRWEEMLSDAVRKGDALGLDSDFVEQILKIIHQGSIESQK